MDTRQIHYFLAVCEQLHFTKAANELGISQPTLSQQIRVLEDELGQPLFDRIGKKILLTEAGRLLRIHGGHMLQAEQDAKKAIQELTVGGGGMLRLGVLPSDLDFQLVPLFIYFHEQFPAIQLQAISSLRIHQEVLDNKLELGIGLKGIVDPRLTQIPLQSEPYELLVSRSNPLSQRTSILIHELEPLPFVMYPLGFLGRELVNKKCGEHGFHIRTVMETTTATSLLQLARADIGVTIQPKSLLKRHPAENELVSIPIVDDPPERHLELVYRSDRYVSTAQKQLAQWLIDFFNS